MSDEQELEHRLSAIPPRPRCGAFGLSEVNIGRRLFARAGLAAPVLLALPNRPAWANNCSESARASITASPGLACDGGEGCSPGFWMNNKDVWHHKYPPTAGFNAVFGVGWFDNGVSLGLVIDTPQPGDTGLPILNLNGCDCPEQSGKKEKQDCANKNCDNSIRQLAWHSVAALQNAATAVDYDYDTTTVISIVYQAWRSGDRMTIESAKNDFASREFNCPERELLERGFV